MCVFPAVCPVICPMICPMVCPVICPVVCPMIGPMLTNTQMSLSCDLFNNTKCPCPVVLFISNHTKCLSKAIQRVCATVLSAPTYGKYSKMQ